MTKSRIALFTLVFLLLSAFVILRISYTSHLRNGLFCASDVKTTLDPGKIRQSDWKIRFKGTKRYLPQCIVIGVRKCGTRALLEFLNLHPQIQAAAPEVHFFDRDENYDLGLEWYRRKMPYSFEDQITIEKSPAYFITEDVPERIYKMNSSIKLIVIFRDPTIRAISDYTQVLDHKIRKGKKYDRFESLVIDPDTGLVNTKVKAIRISVYHHYLERWLEVFERKQFHFVDGDKLIVDPLSEIHKVEKFLEIDHRITKDNIYYNRSKGFYCMRNESSERCLNESKGRKHPDVDPYVITQLQDYFKPHNQKLFQMIRKKFQWPPPKYPSSLVP